MAVPRVESVAANIATTLATVTTANSYEVTLDVDRVFREGNSPSHLKCIIAGSSIAESEHSANKKRWRWSWTYEIFVSPAEAATAETVLHQAWADASKALMVDPTRGGYAIDTFIESPYYGSRERGEFDSIIGTVTVDFRHDRDDPYAA